MDVFAEIAQKIILEQQGIIGPVALEQAKKVPGLKIDWQNRKFSFEGDRKKILESLVSQYENLFGRASVEVCKDAVKGMISKVPSDQLPYSLR